MDRLVSLFTAACLSGLCMTRILLAQPGDNYAIARAHLVEEVLKGGGITNQRVLDVSSGQRE